MRHHYQLGALALTALLGGCAGSGAPTTAHRAEPSPPLSTTTTASPRTRPPRPQALVTEETQARLAVVDLKSGKVQRRVAMPPDPEFVTANRDVVVVVSPSPGVVSVLDRSTLRPIRTLRGFDSPHIAEIPAAGAYAYVTDDARGQLTAIRLRDGSIAGRVSVGTGAHHMAVSPDGKRIWIALGESARTIVAVDSSDPRRLRVTGRFDPGFAAHDLAYTPDGRRVWITASDTTSLGVFDSNTRRLLFRVAGGAPPQHVAFAGAHAYVTSGYGDQIEAVRAATGAVLKVARAEHGAFNLDSGGGVVAAASLLDGTLTVYDRRLRPLRTEHLAPAARDVAISSARPHRRGIRGG